MARGARHSQPLPPFHFLFSPLRSSVLLKCVGAGFHLPRISTARVLLASVLPTTLTTLFASHGSFVLSGFIALGFIHSFEWRPPPLLRFPKRGNLANAKQKPLEDFSPSGCLIQFRSPGESVFAYSLNQLCCQSLTSRNKKIRDKNYL
jgi:hypothetical protein